MTRDENNQNPDIIEWEEYDVDDLRSDDYAPYPYEAVSYTHLIGAIIETPGFYPNLTGTENLEIFAKLRGTIRPDAVEHALQVVGLPYQDKDVYKRQG